MYKIIRKSSRQVKGELIAPNYDTRGDISSGDVDTINREKRILLNQSNAPQEQKELIDKIKNEQWDQLPQ